MATKVVSTVKKVVTEPIKEIKAGIKAAAKPATDKGTGEIFIGAVLGAPAGWVYSKGWEKLVSILPEKIVENKVGLTLIKLALPLLPIYFVKKSKIPFGTMINGLLLGIFGMNIFLEIYGLVKGGVPNNNDTPAETELSLATGLDYV